MKGHLSAQQYLDIARVILVVIDRDQRVSLINRRGSELLGYGEGEIIGKNWFDHFVPARIRERVRLSFERMVAGEIELVETFENPVITAAGGERVILWHNTLLTDGESTIIGTLSSGEDITDRKRAERELRKLNRTLEKRVQEEMEKRIQQERMLIQQSKMAAMGEMISAIAHQWRQPLNNLGLIVQDIKSAYRFGELDGPYIEKAVVEAMEQIEFMSHTIDAFRSFLRPSRGKETFDVQVAANEVISICSAQFRNFFIHIRIEGETSAPLYVYGFPNEFKQVLLNALSNAKDAVLEGRQRGLLGSDEGEISVAVSPGDGKAAIVVRDNGGGVPGHALERLFEPYFTTKEPGKGTGLGLYMSRTIIESGMGGRISLRNVEGGAECRIEVPSVPAESPVS